MPMPTKTQTDRWNLVMGIVTVAAAILLVILDIVMPEELAVDDWVALPAVVLLALFGLCMIGAGLGYIKVRDEKWK
jgi:VIT1/CCC1 family predicted Fe2+/Mn2+ transporter